MRIVVKNVGMNIILMGLLLSVATACSKHAQSGTVVVNPPSDTTQGNVQNCTKCIILAEQLQQRVAIADVNLKKIIWEWKPEMSNVKPEHLAWFSDVSDAKLVYNGKYLLATASGGGVALIRIADRKTVFYAYAGGNTHSAEILPDGNIVSASSTGNYLTVFKVDTTLGAAAVHSKNIATEFGHNVVWDNKHQVLWSAAMNKLKSYRYNFNCAQPDLTLLETISIPGTEAHDLFPVYGTDSLWLTNTTNVYVFDTDTKQLVQANTPQEDIKSISSGPAGFPTIISHPKEQWWTDEILDISGKSIFKQSGLKIYKARWLIVNTFSYPGGDSIKQCK
jgi:hypothetical protein